jgi:hypothetical protein
MEAAGDKKVDTIGTWILVDTRIEESHRLQYHTAAEQAIRYGQKRYAICNDSVQVVASIIQAYLRLTPGAALLGR